MLSWGMISMLKVIALQDSASAVGFFHQQICTQPICELVEFWIEAMIVYKIWHYLYNLAPISVHLTSSQICWPDTREKAELQHNALTNAIAISVQPQTKSNQFLVHRQSQDHNSIESHPKRTLKPFFSHSS